MERYEFRAYVIVNLYSQGIQTGVQGAHALANLAVEAPGLHREWAVNDKTLIFLRGGDPESLDVLAERLEDQYHHLVDALGYQVTMDTEIPVASFQEPALGNSTTAIAVLLPVLPDDFEVRSLGQLYTWEWANSLKDFKLAT